MCGVGEGVSGGGESGGGQGLVGKSVKLVSRGAGAVQSWMKPVATPSHSSTRYRPVNAWAGIIQWWPKLIKICLS